MELELKNKNVLVTGSNRGTGQVIAESFVREGARVFFHRPETFTRTNSTKGNLIWGDITTDDGADQVFQQVREQVSHLDILVNNAGWTTRVDHADHAALTNEILFKTIEVNVYGTWWMCKAAMPHLKKTEGCIVNVTSIAGLRPMGSSLAYGMAKAALNALTEDLAKFHGPVRCNAVAPGLVATPWTSESVSYTHLTLPTKA